MRCETARRLMMDRLYETVSPEKNNLLDTHLDHCRICAAEWEEVQCAHRLMQSLPDRPVPLYLQQAVLEQMQSGALPPNSESFSRNWPKWAAAAVFLIIVGISYSIWETDHTKPPTDASLINSEFNTIALNKLNGSLHKTATPLEEKELSIPAFEEIVPNDVPPKPSQADPEQDPKVQTTIAQQPAPAIEHPIVSPQSPESKKAEELFRTGLRLYNNAFTKVENDRNVLLHSAILMLDDLEKLHPQETPWISMGMILKADSYRELGESEKSIETYRQMTERFAENPTYCQQARASMIKLLLQGDDRVEETEQQLVQYLAQAPPPIEFATLALAFSEKVASSSPDQAFTWYQEIKRSLPEQHPIREKASRMCSEIEQKVRDKYYIHEWKIIGPFPQDTLPEGDLSNPKFDLSTSLAKTAKHYKNAKTVQRQSQESSIVDVAELLNQSPAKSSVFAQTFIFSPIDQWVNLRIGFTDGLRMWMNGDPISGGVENQNFRRDIYGIGCKLKQGWNTLLLKSYHIRDIQEWQFSVLVIDGEGNFIPDLQYNASDKSIPPKK